MSGYTGQVRVDFAHDPMSASFTWTDITNRTRSASYRRGRNYERAQVEAGTGTLKLRNDDGALDPSNTSSPYSPNVLPFRRIQHNITVTGLGTVPIFTGLVERWPQEWGADGYGAAPVQVVDIFAWLVLTKLRTAMQQEVLADAPYLYLPLTDDSSTTTPGMVVAPSGAVAAMVQSKNGAGSTFAFGGGPGPVGEGTHGLLLTPVSTQYGYFVNVNLTAPIAAGATVAAVRVIYSGTGSPINTTLMHASQTDDSLYRQVLGLDIQGGTGKVVAYVNYLSTSIVSTTAVNDGNPHEIVLTVSGGTATLYIDGINSGSAAVASSLTGIGSVQVGGIASFGGASCTPGTFSHAALFIGNLPNINNEYTAGATGFAGETADTRIARILRYAGWTATTDMDACTTTMLAADLDGKSPLEAIQNVQASEGGAFFASKAGVLTYRSRRTRMQTTTSAATFGESTSGGEVPYVDIAFDFDPTYVYNDVQIDRTGVGHAVAASSATSQVHYGKRTYPATFDTQSDAEAQDAANWTLNESLAPHLRVRSVTIDCLATAGAWAAVLPLEVGSRVTVKRRPPGTGTTITANSFVESISWDIVDGRRARCTLELSPIPLQALIADDATYGVCDSTFVAAW